MYSKVAGHLHAHEDSLLLRCMQPYVNSCARPACGPRYLGLVGSPNAEVWCLFVVARANFVRLTTTAAASRRPVQTRPSTRSHLPRQIRVSAILKSIALPTHTPSGRVPTRPHSTRCTSHSLNAVGTFATPLYALNMMLRMNRYTTQ